MKKGHNSRHCPTVQMSIVLISKEPVINIMYSFQNILSITNKFKKKLL